MISMLIFSKDRPAQLYLCIKSFEKYSPNNFRFYVLWKASNDKFKEGYSLFREKYKDNPNVEMVEQTNFQDNVRAILNTTPSKCFGLCTDDSYIYEPFELNDDKLCDFLENNDTIAFSLRLGENIKYQNHWEPYQNVTHPRKLIHKYDNKDKVYVWNCLHCKWEEDYGRPISLDGNIHTTKFLKDILNNHGFNCPRTLDAIDVRHRTHPYMSSFEHSKLVNVPVNLCYGGYADNYSKEYSYSLEEINDKWLGGYVPILMVDKDVTSSHMEFKIRFFHSNTMSKETVDDVMAWSVDENATFGGTILKKFKKDYPGPKLDRKS